MRKILTLILIVLTTSQLFGQETKKYYSIKEALLDSANVKSISLSGDSLVALPQEILKLKNLEEIDLESSKNLNVESVIYKLSQLNHLKKLWISDVNISSLNGISNLKKLEELYLDNVGITALPDEVSRMKNLREVNLEENPQLNMVQAFKVLSKLDRLKTLWIGKNKLSDLPDQIANLKSLEELWLDDNEFTQIPKSVKRLKIKYVSFFSNKIKYINLKKGDLTNLTNINLCYNEFKRFPVELSCLPNLESITMWYSSVTYIPKAIEKFKKLQFLNLESNSIKKIPFQITKLTQLKVLELRGNELDADGVKYIYRLKNLSKLDLYQNKIDYLEPSIWDLKNLTELSVAGNPLTQIPESVSKLQKLKTIQLGYYQSFDWSGAISVLGKLPNLEHVGMFKMNLKNMPEGFERLVTVKEFWMNWNIFDEKEKERITSLLPNAKFVFN